MKKAIALLTSLFFISLISVLILENLTNTDTLLKEKNHDFANTQMMISLASYQKEIGALLFEHKENLDVILPRDFPLDIKNLITDVSIKQYDSIYDINIISDKDEVKKEKIKELFSSNNVSYDNFAIFFNYYMQNLRNTNPNIRVNSLKQLKFILKSYKNNTGNTDMKNIENQLNFIAQDEDSIFIECVLDFDINKKLYSSKSIYKLTNTWEVVNFEITFK